MVGDGRLYAYCVSILYIYVLPTVSIYLQMNDSWI
jgi:hypothetical protein